MLKRFGVGLLACLLSITAAPKILCSLGSGASAYKVSSDQRPSSDAMQLVNRVNVAAKAICASACPAVAVFRNATAANAIFIADAGQGKMAYSPQFFAAVHESFGDPGIVAIIAHEFGHALDDAMGAAWIKKDWTPELRADSWAGCALARNAMSAADMQMALAALAKYPSPSHPSWALRLPAIRAGYIGCAGDISKFNTANPGNIHKTTR